METKRNKEWRKKQCFRVFKKRMMVRMGGTTSKRTVGLFVIRIGSS